MYSIYTIRCTYASEPADASDRTGARSLQQAGLLPCGTARPPGRTSSVLGARCVRATVLFYPWAPRSLGTRRGPRPWATPCGEKQHPAHDPAWALCSRRRRSEMGSITARVHSIGPRPGLRCVSERACACLCTRSASSSTSVSWSNTHSVTHSLSRTHVSPHPPKSDLAVAFQRPCYFPRSLHRDWPMTAGPASSRLGSLEPGDKTRPRPSPSPNLVTPQDLGHRHTARGGRSASRDGPERR